MPELKLGLIGCGCIVQLVHLNILISLPDVELVALAESDPERREEARRRVPRAVVFADYRELLVMPEIEAVVICLPNALHAEATIAALEQGKHVYLEKPLAMNLDEAQDVLAAWGRAGVVGMIGFNYRFNELYQAAKRYIQSGRLGELISVRSVFSSSSQILPAWKQTRLSGGGVLLDLASHHIDLVRFIFGGEIQEVFARVWSLRSEDDSAMLEMRLVNGLPIQSFFSMSSVDEDCFEIYTTAGKLRVDRYLSLNIEVTDAVLPSTRLKRLGRGLNALVSSPRLLEKILTPSREHSYQIALSHFVSAVRSKEPTTPDFWDGYRNVAVIEAAERSARTKGVISLSDRAYGDPVR